MRRTSTAGKHIIISMLVKRPAGIADHFPCARLGNVSHALFPCEVRLDRTHSIGVPTNRYASQRLRNRVRFPLGLPFACHVVFLHSAGLLRATRLAARWLLWASAG
jgi:hypothetical protein